MTPEKNTPKIPIEQKFLYFLNVAFKPKEIEGLDNLESLSSEEPAIIVTTHRTVKDIGMSINTLGNRVPFMVSDVSTHEHAEGDIADITTFAAQKVLGLLGPTQFTHISFDWRDKKKKAAMFNPEDFSKMATAMQETGKNLLIAAHNPEQDEPTPGYGAAYLALITGAPILPMAVDADNKSVVIGESFHLHSESDPTILHIVAEKRASGEKISAEELQQFNTFVRDLRQQGKLVFDTVNQLDTI